MKTIQETVDQFNQVNELYDVEDFLEKFDYLTNRNRGDSITKNKLLNCYYEGNFGKVFRKLDPIAFNVSRSE